MPLRRFEGGLDAGDSRYGVRAMTALAEKTVERPAPRSLNFVKVSQLLFEPGRVNRAFLESVRMHGVLTPLLVSEQSPSGGEIQFIVRDGRRRAAAALETGLDTVPVHIVTGSAEECDAWTIILNLHRSRNVAGELRALRTLLRSGLDEEAIEAKLGLYRKDAKRLFALLALVEEAEVHLRDGRLSPSTALVLAGLTALQQRQFLCEMGEGKPTLAAAKAFRLRAQYAPEQLTFLRDAIPSIDLDLK